MIVNIDQVKTMASKHAAHSVVILKSTKLLSQTQTCNPHPSRVMRLLFVNSIRYVNPAFSSIYKTVISLLFNFWHSAIIVPGKRWGV